MRRTGRWAAMTSLAVALSASAGCTIYYDRKFVQKTTGTFETWHPDVYVHAEVHTAQEWATEHRYSVSVYLSTEEMVYRDPKHKRGIDFECRPSDFDAHLEAVRIEAREESGYVDFPLGNLQTSAGDCWTSLSSEALVPIPKSVRELRAHVTATFRRKDDGASETRVFVVTLRKYEEAIPFFIMA